jgi:hypothetical protein
MVRCPRLRPRSSKRSPESKGPATPTRRCSRRLDHCRSARPVCDRDHFGATDFDPTAEDPRLGSKVGMGEEYQTPIHGLGRGRQRLPVQKIKT